MLLIFNITYKIYTKFCRRRKGGKVPVVEVALPHWMTWNCYDQTVPIRHCILSMYNHNHKTEIDYNEIIVHMT